jgi:general secretion pathway protein D
MFALTFLCVVLAGCAGERAYREGKELLSQDKVEAGLGKFKEAIGEDPHNVEYKEAYLQTRERAVYAWLEEADRQAAEGNRGDAERLYQRVLTIDPGSDRARAGMRTLGMDSRHIRLLKEAETALEKKEFESARLKLIAVLNENPKNERARDLQRALLENTARPQIETQLSAAYKKPIKLEFKDAALKQVFEVISRTSGLNFLFDKDVKTDQKTSIFLKDSTIESAIHFTLLTNQLEQQVLDANTIMIYPNTAAKQKDYQEMVVRSFYLANADAKMVGNTLKTLLKVRDVVVDEKLNMLIMRDSKEAITLAEKLIALQDVAEPEVMLEVEILEVKRTRLLELGIQWPNSLSLTPLSLTGASGKLTLADLGHQNSDTLAAGVSPATVRARSEDSDANLLANPRIRTRNHEKAKIMIGDRVPNITTTATATGFVSEAINYVDVGLRLEVEPTIYLDNDVAIKISMEVSNIVSQLKTQSGTVAYQIGTRNASTVLRLKDGETQVLAGLINDDDRKNAYKVPGLGDLPVLGRLFGSTSDNSDKTEIVLSITPHLIRNILRPEAAQSEFHAGTESSMRTRPDSGSGGSVTSTTIAAINTSPAGTTTNASPAAAVNASSAGKATNVPSGNIGAAAIGVGSGASATAGVAQLNWQGPTQLRVGDTFTLQLMVQSNQPVTSVPLAIGFDNQVLQIVGVTEGDFLKQGGAQTSFTNRIDPTGQILVTASSAGDVGATALASIVTLNFKTLTIADASRIQLLAVSPIGTAGHSISAPLPPPQVIQVLP